MSDPKSLREILTERGLIAREVEPLRLLTFRCGWCGCLQHQLVPSDARSASCLECRRNLSSWDAYAGANDNHPSTLEAREYVAALRRDDFEPAHCIDCNRVTFTPLSDHWHWMPAVRKWRCGGHK